MDQSSSQLYTNASLPLSLRPSLRHLFILSVGAEPEGVVVRVEGAGGAGVAGLGAGAERHREVESEVDSIADLLGGAGGQLEQMLVVREDVVQGGILGVANILENLEK